MGHGVHLHVLCRAEERGAGEYWEDYTVLGGVFLEPPEAGPDSLDVVTLFGWREHTWDGPVYEQVIVCAGGFGRVTVKEDGRQVARVSAGAGLRDHPVARPFEGDFLAVSGGAIIETQATGRAAAHVAVVQSQQEGGPRREDPTVTVIAPAVDRTDLAMSRACVADVDLPPPP